MKRRDVLISLAAAASALMAGSRLSWGAIWRAGQTDADLLLAALPSRDSAAVVGRVFLDGHPNEADRAALATRVMADLRATVTGRLEPSPEAVRGAFRDRVRREFAASEVVRVDGWILSRTEARLCGLAALS